MINKRMEEAEERIDKAETRIQFSEEFLAELMKLQVQTEAKPMDLQGQLRRENVRLYGVKEGAEESKVTVTAFVEDLLIKGLELPTTTDLNIGYTPRVQKKEGLHRSKSCAEGEKHKISDSIFAQAAGALQGRHVDLQFSRGGNGRYGEEGNTGEGSEKPNFPFGSDQPAVLATQRKAGKPGEHGCQAGLYRATSKIPTSGHLISNDNIMIM